MRRRVCVYVVLNSSQYRESGNVQRRLLKILCPGAVVGNEKVPNKQPLHTECMWANRLEIGRMGEAVENLFKNITKQLLLLIIVFYKLHCILNNFTSHQDAAFEYYC